jgi:hypothetical protein
MPEDRPSRRSFVMLAFAAVIAWPITGCDSGSGTERVEVSPESQKKTNDYLENYKKQMVDEHKGKPSTKKSK